MQQKENPEIVKFQQLKKECLEYFKEKRIWKKIMEGFREKYSSYGRFAGKVTARNLSLEDIEELEGFFGENYHGKKSVTISAEKFQKCLEKSKYRSIPASDILSAFFGEQMLGKAEIRALAEQKADKIRFEYHMEFQGTPAEACLKNFERLLQSVGKKELEQWKSSLWLCANIYNALPYRKGQKLYLAVFAARITGNPHAFDHGTRDGNLLYQVIQEDLNLRGIKVQQSPLFQAYKKQKSYLLAGIMVDDISNYALLYQVCAQKKTGGAHRGMEGFFLEKDIVQIPLAVVDEWNSLSCVNGEIYIVENPSIFGLICKEQSCMCMNGQPKLASLLVLELLAKAGVKVYYSGDLDPEGLLIAQKLSQFYGGEFHYWHMTEADYEACRSKEILTDRRLKMLENITDPELLPVVEAMRKVRVAGYQENIENDFFLKSESVKL